MVDVVVRATAPGDIGLLFANMRASDRAECEAYGVPVYETIRSSAARSLLCWTGLIDGELAAIIGVTPFDVLGGVGTPWMLGTPVLDRHSRILVRRTPEYIAHMLAAFPHLVNYVHAKNTTSVRWLRRLGFTLHEPEPFGPFGEPFHRFERHA